MTFAAPLLAPSDIPDIFCASLTMCASACARRHTTRCLSGVFCCIIFVFAHLRPVRADSFRRALPLIGLLAQGGLRCARRFFGKGVGARILPGMRTAELGEGKSAPRHRDDAQHDGGGSNDDGETHNVLPHGVAVSGRVDDGYLKGEQGHQRSDETDVPELLRDGVLISRRAHELHDRGGAFHRREDGVDDDVADAAAVRIEPDGHLHRGSCDDPARHDEHRPVDDGDDVSVTEGRFGRARALCGESFRKHHARAHDDEPGIEPRESGIPRRDVSHRHPDEIADIDNVAREHDERGEQGAPPVIGKGALEDAEPPERRNETRREHGVLCRRRDILAADEEDDSCRERERDRNAVDRIGGFRRPEPCGDEHERGDIRHQRERREHGERDETLLGQFADLRRVGHLSLPSRFYRKTPLRSTAQAQSERSPR